MPDIRILTESELRSLIQLDLAAVECVEKAFHALATKAVVMPPIMRLDIIENNGEIDVKTAYIPGVDSLAIKISPGFFDNPSLGLPSTNGLMVLFSTRKASANVLTFRFSSRIIRSFFCLRITPRVFSPRCFFISRGARSRVSIVSIIYMVPIAENRPTIRPIIQFSKVLGKTFLALMNLEYVSLSSLPSARAVSSSSSLSLLTSIS